MINPRDPVELLRDLRPPTASQPIGPGDNAHLDELLARIQVRIGASQPGGPCPAHRRPQPRLFLVVIVVIVIGVIVTCFTTRPQDIFNQVRRR